MQKNGNQKGFSLMEVMIVVTILGVLAAIAYPSYMEYVKRTKRVDVQSEMMRIAQRLQSYRVIHHNYTGATLAAMGASEDYPVTNPMYGLELETDNQTWVLIATPVGAQIGDGHIVLNHQGHRCRIKGSDKNNGTACVTSSASKWD